MVSTSWANTSNAPAPLPQGMPVSNRSSTTSRVPSQMKPSPSVLQVSNDGGAGFSGCVTGCPAIPAGASTKVTTTPQIPTSTIKAARIACSSLPIIRARSLAAREVRAHDAAVEVARGVVLGAAGRHRLVDEVAVGVEVEGGDDPAGALLEQRASNCLGLGI